jgi:hypothetical protein
MEWKTIDSAPKDGTEFQAWIVGSGCSGWEPRCRYSDEGTFQVWGRIDYDIDGWDFLVSPTHPTHWMATPSAPPSTT